MKRLMFLARVVLLMTMAMGAESAPTASSDAITVESGAVTFSGALQEPAITTAPVPQR